jgi:hypothetical protein
MMNRLSRHGGPPWVQRDWEGPHHPRGEHGPHGHHHPRGQHLSPEQLALGSTAAEVARLFAIASRSNRDNAEKQAQLRAWLERSRKELSDLISGTAQQRSPETASGVE